VVKKGGADTPFVAGQSQNVVSCSVTDSMADREAFVLA
jgi:hypothetical protein